MTALKTKKEFDSLQRYSSALREENEKFRVDFLQSSQWLQETQERSLLLEEQANSASAQRDLMRIRAAHARFGTRRLVLEVDFC